MAAEPLLQLQPDEVAKHEVRRSRQTFQNSYRFQKQNSRAGLLFSPKPWKEDKTGEAWIVDSTELDRCATSEVLRRKVYHHSAGSEAFDVLYYSASSPADKKKVNSYRARAVPYEASVSRDPKTGQVDRWQMFARFVQIPCLPTRFHFVYEGKQRYIEYRMGQKAWE